jgi:hypothetical protein
MKKSIPIYPNNRKNFLGVVMPFFIKMIKIALQNTGVLSKIMSGFCVIGLKRGIL